MGDTLGWAESSLGDTESTLSTILALVRRTDKDTQDISARLRALFRQDGRDDPVREKTINVFRDKLVEQLSKNPALLKAATSGASIQVTLTGNEIEDIAKSELNRILTEAITEAEKKMELAKYSVEIKSASKSTKQELDRFAELVSEGGEVAPGVRQRLKSAAKLGFIIYEGAIVGTAALKNPNPARSKNVFEAAGNELNSEGFPLELGWIFLQPIHRHKGQMRLLTKLLVDSTANLGIYAATRIKNEAMQGVLNQNGFIQTGANFPSKQNPGEELALYIRRPAK